MKTVLQAGKHSSFVSCLVSSLLRSLLLEGGLSLLGSLDLVPQARRDSGQCAVLPSVALKTSAVWRQRAGGRWSIAKGRDGWSPAG